MCLWGFYSGTRRRDSVTSDISDLDDNADAPALRAELEAMHDRCAQFEVDIRNKDKSITKLRAREKELTGRIDLESKRSTDALDELHTSAMAGDEEAALTVEAVMRELDLTKTQLAKKDAYIVAVAAKLDEDGVLHCPTVFSVLMMNTDLDDDLCVCRCPHAV